MSLDNPRFESTTQMAQSVRYVERRFKAVRGVAAIATTSALPLLPGLPMPFTILRNEHSLLGRYDGTATWRSVSPQHFKVFQIRLLRGRMFTDEDDEKAAGVVLINRTMMNEFWQEIDANPIGHFISIGKGEEPSSEDIPRQIVGVIVDVRDAGLDREPSMYVPLAQVPDRMNARNNRLLPTGIPSALALARVTISLIFGTQTWDPILLGLVALLLCTVYLLAAYVPSMRACRVDPAVALCSET